MTETEFSV